MRCESWVTVVVRRLERCDLGELCRDRGVVGSVGSGVGASAGRILRCGLAGFRLEAPWHASRRPLAPWGRSRVGGKRVWCGELEELECGS